MIFSGMLQVWKISKGPYINAIGKNEVRVRTIKSRGPVIYYDNTYGFDSYELSISLPKDKDCPFNPGMLIYVNGEIRTINSKYDSDGNKWIYILVCDHKDIKIIGHVDLPCDPAAHIKETRNNARGI